MLWNPLGRVQGGEAMPTYVLVHGSGADAWYWHRVVPELRARGHDVVAPDLPAADDSAGLDEYADVIVDAIGDRRDLIVVAQSLGGFTAPIVCSRVPVSLLVFVDGDLDESQVLPTVEEITSRRPRTYEQWARAHAEAFS
jgi:pimeloyl-ACP methyl ester carboxylesterase